MYVLSARSGSCSVDMESVRLFRLLGGGRYKQKKCSVLCCRVIDTCTTSNEVGVMSMSVLNVMLEPKIDLYIVAIPPPRDRECRGNELR